jgi:hypothetical protein
MRYPIYSVKVGLLMTTFAQRYKIGVVIMRRVVVDVMASNLM